MGVGLLGSGCQAVYGIRAPRALTQEQVQQVAGQFGIPANQFNSTELDTSYYQHLRHLHQQQPEAAKNHLQPLQAVYYNAAGQQQSFHVNCYAGGFPTLAWNRSGIFDQFPPAQQAPRDSALSLAEHLRFLRPSLRPDSLDYTVVVHWNQFMSRHSRRLVQAVQHNVALAPAGIRVRVVYANTDAFYRFLFEQQDQPHLAPAPQRKTKPGQTGL